MNNTEHKKTPLLYGTYPQTFIVLVKSANGATSNRNVTAYTKTDAICKVMETIGSHEYVCGTSRVI